MVKPATHRAFTLLELLVVIAIVAVLLGLLFPALHAIRASGRRTREVAAARELLVAYSAYAYDHRGVLMPGYYDFNGTLPAFNEAGRDLTELDGGTQIAARYPWRLAPYLDYNLDGLYLDELVLGELARQARREYWISLLPSLGINRTFVGGDYRENLGLADPDLEKYYGKVYLTRLSEARHPPRLIVFASARYGGDDLPGNLPGGVSVIEGFHRVEPPYLFSAKWGNDRYEVDGDAQDFGFVSLRHHGREAAIGFLDGHTGTLGDDSIRDMRRWSDQADRRDWTVEPLVGPG